MKYQFEDCSCQFDELTVDNMRLDCPKTWNLFHKGLTKGIFQVDSQLGKQWSQKVKPTSIEHLGAIGAIVRPGVLKSNYKGKSLTQHYSDRKNNIEPIEEYNPIVDRCLKDTYGILVYQEQTLELVKEIAQFDLNEADKLRRGIGKKLADVVAEVKKIFLSRAKELNIIPYDKAEEVFEWIKKGERYSFNKSHAISYALTGYHTAYIKAHFPLIFFYSWLKHAHEKLDPQTEIKELINEAKLFNIQVLPPDLRTLQRNFYIEGQAIRFGLSDIKGVGESVLNTVSHLFKDIELASLSWPQFLYNHAQMVNKTSVMALIGCGALYYMGVPRSRMSYEYTKWSQLSEREQKCLKSLSDKTLVEALRIMVDIPRKEGGPANKNRVEFISNMIKLLDNPPYSLDDYPDRVIAEEERLLGVSLSYSKVDTVDNLKGNCTAKEFLEGKQGYCVIDAEINNLRSFKIKKEGKNFGKYMAFMCLSDQSYILDSIVCFPDVYKDYQHLLTDGNLVSVVLERDKKTGGGIIKKVSQL